ncbi:MAG: adenylate/guanylate cyclase domain-containing protein, partial [Phycisphaerales bacterium]|nr:adenylate/guanylate cyclase domain-containing protein [Phycisphaerales bacterium]
MRLRVQSSATDESKSYDLPDGAEVVLGRSAQVDVPVADEPCLSRRHVVMRAQRTNLDVKRIPDSSNPVVFRGQPVDSFTMHPGEFFVIGRTTFHLERAASVADASPSQVGEPSPEQTYTMEMDEVRSRSGSGDRLRLLDLMELPVVLRTKTRSEFFVYACGALRMAAGADWVQLLMNEETGWIVLAEDAHTDQAFDKPVSARLVKNAIEESPKPVTYCWRAAAGSADFDATAHEGVDWAICCAMPVPGEPHVLFYLAGASEGAGGKHGIGRVAGSDMTLRDTARLVGLVSDMVGRAIAMQKLESWQSRLGQFFSDKVVSEILGSDPEKALEPRRTDATVMFFDIGGFSLRSEQNLNRIIEFTKERRTVLNAMAAAVIAHDGVIIAYVGDGMLGCWNVPRPMDDHAEKACLAALDMADWMRRES